MDSIIFQKTVYSPKSDLRNQIIGLSERMLNNEEEIRFIEDFLTEKGENEFKVFK
jgi:hypothetical protein